MDDEVLMCGELKRVSVADVALLAEDFLSSSTSSVVLAFLRNRVILLLGAFVGFLATGKVLFLSSYLEEESGGLRRSPKSGESAIGWINLGKKLPPSGEVTVLSSSTVLKFAGMLAYTLRDSLADLPAVIGREL